MKLQSAFVYAYDDSARSLCDSYLNNVEAFCNKTKMIDPITEDELEPDEKMMRSIEEQIGISTVSKAEFRTELLTRMASMFRKGETFDYTSHPRLRDAIEKKLFADMKDIVQLTTSTKVPNEEQKSRLHTVQETLVDERGYCDHCAGELIRYVGAMLSRSSS